MAEKLNAENIEKAVQHLEDIQTGKTPILSDLEGNIKEKQKKVFPLIPPNDPRLLMQVAPFLDETLEQFGFADRKELSKVMYDNMAKYGGLGLSANQIGLPYRMFVMGGHPQIEDGKVRSVFNPLINDVSPESINLKEGCLSFPFLFLSIKRPKWVHAKYTDENGEEVDEYLHGMPARIWQHENEHMNGYVFTDLVSKLKLDTAKKAQKKAVKKIARQQAMIPSKPTIIT